MIILGGMTELKKFIVEHKKVCLLFSATWCGPCQVLKKKIVESKDSLKNIPTGYCDIENSEFEELIDSFLIKSIPTSIFVELDSTVVKEIGRVDGFDWSKFIMTINSLV